jgi:outer membrane protein OmpA-like peptidoglycan-associated protein
LAAPTGAVSGLDAFKERELAPLPDAPAAAPADPAPTASVAAPPAAGAEADRSEVAAVCLPVVSIPFSSNSARPKIAGLAPAIAPLLDWLATHQGAVMSVEGHADSSGTERHNVLLSFSRAQAVKAWLARAGAREKQLAARAAGTLAPTNPVEAESNRQVILQIEGAVACRGPVKTP